MNLRRGISLIECLVLVGVAAIGLTITVPKYVKSQVRSHVARAKADLAKEMVALDFYFVDHDNYPPMADRNLYEPVYQGMHGRSSTYLTTPIAYIDSLSFDPFVPDSYYSNAYYPYSTNVGKRYVYYNSGLQVRSFGDTWNGLIEWVGLTLMYSYGPDQTPFAGASATLMPYDPTNGIISPGNIIRCQRKEDGIPLHPVTGTYIWN